jgi:transposase
VLPDHARGKPLEVWYQDEARVGQQGTLTRVWAKRGTRPRAPRDTRYVSAYIFGAACPARAVTAALVMPHANTEAMNAHLLEISRTVAPGAHAIIVLDGAGWHGSNALELPDNISFLALPPYAPELNPVENIWAYLRANKLAISVFETYDQIVDACCEAWNFLARDPATIRSIATRDYAKTVNG